MRHATAKKEREKELALAHRENCFPQEMVNGEAAAEEGLVRPHPHPHPPHAVPKQIRAHPPPQQITQVQKVCAPQYIALR